MGEGTGEDILILTDSLGCVRAVERNVIRALENDYILEIRKRYFDLARVVGGRERRVALAWIPAHQGIYGNEVADCLAKEATDAEPSEELKIPSRNLRGKHRERCYNNTIIKIKNQASDKGRKYFRDFFRENERSPWFAGLNLPRRYITLINRLRADHYNLNSSLYRKRYVESPRCECGAEEEDINHLLFNCGKYDATRQVFYDDLNRVGATGPDCAWNWLRREEMTTIRVMCDFIISTGRVV